MKKVHIISIGGAIMHNIAIQLAGKGYKVTGSDDILFDPSLSRLKSAGLLPTSLGWFPENIHPDLDFVILGMHAKADNPELLKAQQLGLKIFSFPSFIREQAEDQVRIVVSGSHGKTTTASMIVHLFNAMGKACDHLIGAKIEGVEDIVTFDGHPYFVIEGDEYPSSAIDPRPKFLHYDPDFLIITGIAWDHMNVFPTYESYFDSFVSLLQTIRPECTVIYNSGDPEVVRLVDQFDLPTVIPYDYLDYHIGDGGFVIEEKYPLRIIGRHNIENLTAAVTLCEALGLERQEALVAAGSFRGAARRLQSLLKTDHGDVYLDFAHAPSKVTASVRAVRSLYPDQPMIAVLELHTFSSLNKDFLPQYKGALDLADRAIVMFDAEIMANKNMPPLDREIICTAFGREDIETVESGRELEEVLKREIDGSGDDRTNILLMSSGSFGGIDLKKKLQELWNL